MSRNRSILYRNSLQSYYDTVQNSISNLCYDDNLYVIINLSLFNSYETVRVWRAYLMRQEFIQYNKILVFTSHQLCFLNSNHFKRVEETQKLNHAMTLVKLSKILIRHQKNLIRLLMNLNTIKLNNIFTQMGWSVN